MNNLSGVILKIDFSRGVGTLWNGNTLHYCNQKVIIDLFPSISAPFFRRIYDEISLPWVLFTMVFLMHFS